MTAGINNPGNAGVNAPAQTQPAAAGRTYYQKPSSGGGGGGGGQGVEDDWKYGQGTAGTIKKIIDPAGLVLKSENKAPGPTAAQKLADANAAHYSDEIANGVRKPGDIWAGTTYDKDTGQVTANRPGQTVRQDAPGMLYGAATDPNRDARLNPENSPYFNKAAQFSELAANGGLAQQVGGFEANAAQRAAADAASRVAGAGQDTRALTAQAIEAQKAQAGQTASDLGIVRDSAQGKGPSAAEILGNRFLGQSAQAQAAQAATARGGNVASAMRTAANAGTQTRLAGEQQIGAQRAQEQLNAQTLLGQGNANLGQQTAGVTAAQAGQRTTDIGQAVAGASATNDAAKTATANYGVGSGIATAGLQGLQGAAGLYQQGQQVAQGSQDDATRSYVDFLQKQYSIASGLPVQFQGLNNQTAIANQQANTQKEAANKSAIGSLLGGLLK